MYKLPNVCILTSLIDDPTDVGNLISGSSAFSKSSLNIWRFTVHILLNTEELYKKELHDPDTHDGVITDLEPDILEWEVKWALESITTNKASEIA